MKRIMTSIFTALLAIVAMPVSNAFAANPASFTLSPSTSSVVNGSTFTVSVYENGDNVNAVTTKLTFNASLVQLNSTSCGGSFSSSVAETNGQTCFTSGGTVLNGNVLALNATFTALAGTGSATVSIASGSKIVSSDTNTNIWSGAASATSITLTTPAATPPPTSGGSSPTSGTSSTPSTTTPDHKTPSTQQASTNSPSTDATTPVKTSDVKAASTTKVAVAVTPTTDSAIQKTIMSFLPLFLVALLVFAILTYPLISPSIKKAKITSFVRQQFAKISSK
jgi:hypothetical protein